MVLSYAVTDFPDEPFRHKERQLVCSVHGDDFTVSGPRSSFDWFEAAMKNNYEPTVGGRLGPGRKDDKEISGVEQDHSLDAKWDPIQGRPATS